MPETAPHAIPGLRDEARLLRGFATDFLTSHDPGAAQWVMDPAYCLTISGVQLSGRDDVYLPATVAQLAQFPGLVVTVHDVILGHDGVAMRFTEHGISMRDKGRAAAWGGITLFRIENGRLREGWAEEDYFARKRELKTGQCDPVDPPHPAPWDQPVEAPSPSAEAAVRDWLSQPTRLVAPDVEQICREGPGFEALIAPHELSLSRLFTAGRRAAFHLVCQGIYQGGFPDIDQQLAGTEIALPMAGMVDVAPDGTIARVQLSADRLGLHRHLLGLMRA